LFCACGEKDPGLTGTWKFNGSTLADTVHRFATADVRTQTFGKLLKQNSKVEFKKGEYRVLDSSGKTIDKASYKYKDSMLSVTKENHTFKYMVLSDDTNKIRLLEKGAIVHLIKTQ